MRIEVVLLLSEHPIWQGSDKQREIRWMNWTGAMNLQLLNNSSLSWTLWATAACETRLERQHFFFKKKGFSFFHVPTTRHLLTEERSNGPNKIHKTHKQLTQNLLQMQLGMQKCFARRAFSFLFFFKVL